SSATSSGCSAQTGRRSRSVLSRPRSECEFPTSCGLRRSSCNFTAPRASFVRGRIFASRCCRRRIRAPGSTRKWRPILRPARARSGSSMTMVCPRSTRAAVESREAYWDSTCRIRRRLDRVARRAYGLRSMPRIFGLKSSVFAPVAALLLCSQPPAFAQWRNAPAARAPLTASGEVDLEAPPPKHSNGRVDLQGVWMPDDNRYIRDLALDIGDDKVPYQPWARRLFDERKDGLHSGED